MTMKYVLRVFVVLGGVLTASATTAQIEAPVRFEFSNLLEYQIGRDPTAEEGERTRFFDQFVLDGYVAEGVRLGLRLERFDDSPPPSLFGAPIDEYEYDTLAQRFLEWSDGRTSLRLGNGYAIFGHGLVFRAFELPGVVRQTRFPLASYAESRDLDGVVLQSWRGPLEIVVVHGRPVVRPDVALEQALQQRRSGTVSGGSGMVAAVDGLRVGGSYLRADGLQAGLAESDVEEVGAVELGLEPLTWFRGAAPAWLWISSSLEYAGRNWRAWDGGLPTSTGTPHALYTSTQVGWPSGALSVETKDYHQFLLRVNDPPSLVPEFSHRLLNRTTHVLEPQDEKGHQVTLSQGLPRWFGSGTVELVRARATGRPETVGGYGEARLYEQTFIAVESDNRRAARARLYFSDGRDEFEALEEIRTVGLFGALALPRELAVELDVGHQVRRRRDFVGNVRSEDLSVQATLSRASLGQIGVLWERTDDPLFLDDPFTDAIETEPRRYLIGSVAWIVDQRHDVVVSYGERRGGTACTSGTCYFVPDFSGLELRVRSRF